MNYTVYSLSVGKFKYWGITKDLTKRMYCHKARYNKSIDGWWYKVYEVLRANTKSWNDVKVSVHRTCNTRKEAILVENRLIKTNGNLNTQRKGR